MRIENAGQPLCLPISIMENMPRRLRRPVLAVLTAGLLLGGVPLGAEPVTVRHQEGVVHGFLALRTLDGSTIAAGDLLQTSRGTRVTSRLVFHFRDGSLHDETAVFSQRGTFRLISDHLTQSGPSFPHPLDMTIDAASGTGRRSAWRSSGRRRSRGCSTWRSAPRAKTTSRPPALHTPPSITSSRRISAASRG
jgi:hypothetical protein